MRERNCKLWGHCYLGINNLGDGVAVLSCRIYSLKREVLALESVLFNANRERVSSRTKGVFQLIVLFCKKEKKTHKIQGK